MDKPIFFSAVRSTVFGGSLTTSQVHGLERLITEADKRKLNNEYLAYVLATAAWEGAHTMQPIVERGPKSYFKKYEPNTRIGKQLGNKKPGDGYKYRGRGDVMITGLDNYIKASNKLGVDLATNPDLALDPKISAQILFQGMLDGWFTGKALKDYLDGIDESDKEDMREFANGRRIVNGTDRQIEIAKLALQFETALRSAKRPETGSSSVVEAAPEPEPALPAPSSPAVLPLFVVGLFAAMAAAWTWVLNVPCNLFGIFCGG